jgi:hypothetical protein
MIQLGIEYDPQPPHGGIDWPHLDRDSFGPRVEGFAHQALDEHPELLDALRLRRARITAAWTAC